MGRDGEAVGERPQSLNSARPRVEKVYVRPAIEEHRTVTNLDPHGSRESGSRGGEAAQIRDAPDDASLESRQAGKGLPHINDLLHHVVDVKACDLHLKPGSPPTIRVSGLLQPLDLPVLAPEQASDMAQELMPDKEQVVLEEEGEVDFAHSLPGTGRFRVNVHRQRGSLGIAARRILPKPPDFGELRLPLAVEHLANEHRGLMLVTGPTSSG
jgi:hypothetical protein